MNPADLRAAIASAPNAEALVHIVQSAVARLRERFDDDHVGLVAELVPLAAHPDDRVRRALAHACDAFPGDLFEGTYQALVADGDHFVCAAARQAGDRRAARRKAQQRTEEADHLTADVAAQIETRHGKGALRLARQLAKREVEQYLERMTHETTKLDAFIDRALEAMTAELAKPDASLATLRTRASALHDRVLLQRTVLRRAREYARRLTPAFVAERLASIVDEAREQLVSRLGPRADRLRFVADVPASLEVHADRHAMLQAFQNLLQNAVEAYAPDAEAMTVRVIAAGRRKGTEIELRIEDDGAGMTDAMKATLFIPFRTWKPGGTGVGLLLARKMIEEIHGGALTVESTRGVGTRVTMTLPARQAGVKERA